MNYNDIKAWQENKGEEASTLKPNSLITFGAMRPLGKYDDPESYTLSKGLDAVIYKRETKAGVWIRSEAVMDTGREPHVLSKARVSLEQVQRYIDLAKRFDETYSLPIGETGTILKASMDGDLDKVKACVQRRPEEVHTSLSGDRETSLHLAARLGYKEVTKFLIVSGADVNAKSNQGLTALDYAVKGNHKDLADLLRKHGAKD
jgi:hypothetical protein